MLSNTTTSEPAVVIFSVTVPDHRHSQYMPITKFNFTHNQLFNPSIVFLNRPVFFKWGSMERWNLKVLHTSAEGQSPVR